MLLFFGGQALGRYAGYGGWKAGLMMAGLASQRARAYGGDRDIPRGAFAQFTWGLLTAGGYWFGPGSSEQVFVGMPGLA